MEPDEPAMRPNVEVSGAQGKERKQCADALGRPSRLACQIGLAAFQTP